MGFRPRLADEYNRLMSRSFESIRDFVILHYHLSQRDEDFWRYCRSIDITRCASASAAAFQGEWPGRPERLRRIRRVQLGLDLSSANMSGHGVTTFG
jgi:hypothetical protein